MYHFMIVPNSGADCKTSVQLLTLLCCCSIFCRHRLLLLLSPLTDALLSSCFSLTTVMFLPLSSVPPRVMLSTKHCIVPRYLFPRASSLSVACDIRGLTEQQPVAREDTASLSGREAQCLWGEDRQRGTTWLGWLSGRTQTQGHGVKNER